MNVLSGKIASVTSAGDLSLVRVQCADVFISAIVIDTPDTVPYLVVDKSVRLIFKETEVIVGKGFEHNVSLQNRLNGEVIHIQKGELLSKVTIRSKSGEVSSIITTNAVNQLDLTIGSEACAMIKTNEIMLSE